MLVTSIFSFSHNVLEGLIRVVIVGLFGEGLTLDGHGFLFFGPGG